MKPLILIIRDGYGINKSDKDNAIKLAKTPFSDNLLKFYPNTQLKASGKAVGLPRNVIGTSEVGHLTIGAGRKVDQDIVRINKSIKSGEFYKNQVLTDLIRSVKENDSKLHIMGLLSDGGVHSHINHLFALLKFVKKYNIKKVYIHCFMDGRDVPPRSAIKYLTKLKKVIKQLKTGKIATIIGRYYAMDRDNRWNREHKAYDAMVNGRGSYSSDAFGVIKDSYKNGVSDEFIKPTTIDKEGVVSDGDGIVFFNFRSDRARQITKAFVQGKFNKFQRKKLLDLNFVCLTQYDESIKSPVAFKPIKLKNTLGEVLANKKLTQLRVAETEKYAHVTYFFNGLSGKVFDKEKRILIPSPKVSTYDLKPLMSIGKITKTVLESIKNGRHDVIILNYANADMVGHTGNLNATINAVEAMDESLGRIVREVENCGGTVVITADHGNAEQMFNKKVNQVHTAHTNNKVEFILISNNIKFRHTKLKVGTLADVAPTILQVLNIKQPKEMTGKSLIKNKNI